MSIVKAVVAGLVGSAGVATVAHDLEGTLGALIRMRNLHAVVLGHELYLSLPIFVVITLFAWVFFFWSSR